MTHFLVNGENSTGYKLEEILLAIRKEIIVRATKIVDDHRPEARQVLENNVKILQLLSDCIKLAEDSTHVLDKTFGPGKDGQPRIGTL
jgi:hypothetical protein